MKTKIITILGKEYHMALTTEAMFHILETLEVNQPVQVFEKISETSRQGLQDVCKIASILCEEGEAVRKYQGKDKGTKIGKKLEDDLKKASFGELIALKNSLMEVINEGFKREIVEEEVDEGLKELEKKEEAR